MTMKFETYLEIMQNHGIGETSFCYLGSTYWLTETFNVNGYGGLTFTLSSEEVPVFNSYETIDDLVKDKIFDGRTLQEIWDEVEIISIDGVCENDYNPEECSFNFTKAAYDFGEVQWHYSLSVKQSFLYQLGYTTIGIVILPILCLLFPILGLANWYLALLLFGAALLALLIASIALSRNRVAFNYTVTDKKIFVSKGLSVETTYANIKKVKLKNSKFKKGFGNIKIYVKKGLSLNYHLFSIPDPEYVYNLILSNMNS